MILNSLKRNFQWKRNHTLSAIIMPKEIGQESHVQALTSLIESLSSYGSRFNNETIIPEQKKMKEPLKNNKL